MELIEISLYIILMLTALPVGWLLAWLTKDELKTGKKWFKLILYMLIVIIIIAMLTYRDIPLLLALFYMIIVTLVSYTKGLDKKFVEI